MFRMFLFAALVLLAACTAPRPTPTPSLGPVSFTISPTLSVHELQVGETITVHTDSGDSGLAHYYLYVDGVELNRLSYDGSTVYEPGVPAALRVISAHSDPRSAEWTLEALEPGSHELHVAVNGEVLLNMPDAGWIWAFADSFHTVTVH